MDPGLNIVGPSKWKRRKLKVILKIRWKWTKPKLRIQCLISSQQRRGQKSWLLFWVRFSIDLCWLLKNISFDIQQPFFPEHEEAEIIIAFIWHSLRWARISPGMSSNFYTVALLSHPAGHVSLRSASTAWTITSGSSILRQWVSLVDLPEPSVTGCAYVADPMRPHELGKPTSWFEQWAWGPLGGRLHIQGTWMRSDMLSGWSLSAL